MNLPLLALAASILTLASASATPVEIIPPALHGALQPQIAVAPSGRLHVVFGKDNVVYYTTSPDGRTFSPPVVIAELDKLALKMRRGPRVSATDKLVVVTAISHADGNVHAWTSADTGKTWHEAPSLNSVIGSAREGMQALAGNGRGLVAAVWLDGRTPGTKLRGRISQDGGATWGDDLSIYESPDGHICECCQPSAAISASGEIAVMWRNWLGGSRDLYVATSRDAGKSFAPAQKLGTGTWRFNACPMDGGSISYGPDSHWVATWRRESRVFATQPDAPEQLLAPSARQPVAGFAGATPVLLWEAGPSLILQRGTTPPAPFASSAAAASIASSPTAAFVVFESGAGPTSTLLLDRIP